MGLLFSGHPLLALSESLKAPPLASLLFIVLGLPVYLYLSRQSRRTNED
jgi:hypothetical protein